MADPYLTYDANLKIVNTVPGRGSFYAPFDSSNSNRLSTNFNPFLGTMANSWRSCVGLQRGGELGITSIVETVLGQGAPESAAYGYACMTSTAHRAALASQIPNNDRPILIEEDWISKNEGDNIPYSPYTSPAGSFKRADNPYCAYLLNSQQVPTPNQNAYPFLVDNYDGIRKYFRDSAWMAGVICQAYTSYWTRKYNNLNARLNTSSWAPYKAIQKTWTDVQEWWRFSYGLDIVFSQTQISQLPGSDPAGTFGPWPPACNPLYLAPPLQGYSGTGRPPFEQMAIGARSDHGGVNTQYVIYCPAGGATVMGNLAELGAGATFSYFFVNPDNYNAAVTVNTGTLPGGSTNFAFPAPPGSAQGEHGEYAIFVNCAVPPPP